MDNPLLACKCCKSRLKQLSSEIKHYLQYVELNDREKLLVEQVFGNLSEKIIEFSPTAEIYLTGSVATKLALYNCDIDISVPNVRLVDLHKFFVSIGVNCEFINCQHPIVTGVLGGYEFDISASQFDVLKDIDDAEKLSNKATFLTLILKEIFRSEKMNNLRTGGISSYLLIEMVKAFECNIAVERHCIALAVISFFQFYSTFDYKQWQITDGTITTRSFVFRPQAMRKEPELVILVRGKEIGGAIEDFSMLQQEFLRLHRQLLVGNRKKTNLLRQVISIDEQADSRRRKQLE